MYKKDSKSLFVKYFFFFMRNNNTGLVRELYARASPTFRNIQRRRIHQVKHLALFIPIFFKGAGLLPAVLKFSHIVYLCTGAFCFCGRAAFSNFLDINTVSYQSGMEK